jgi:hypothetical protein
LIGGKIVEVFYERKKKNSKKIKNAS